MNRAFKTEYYPDMTDKDWGKKVLTLSCAVTNGKRFKSLTRKERYNLIEIIERFEASLTAFKNELSTPRRKDLEFDKECKDKDRGKDDVCKYPMGSCECCLNNF